MGAGLPAMFALQAAGEGLSAVNNFNAAKAEGKYVGTAYDINARMKRLQADDAITRGDLEAGDATRDAARVRGSQVAAIAGNGVDVTSGTPAALTTETDVLGQNEVLKIKNNAWREAFGLKAEADSLESQGRMARIAAREKAKNSLVTGGLNMLKTGTDFAGWRAGQPRTFSAADRTRAAYDWKG